jgi:hypothetical protein
VAPFADFIGRPVTLYVNEGTSDVIAFNDGDTTHTTDWYVHPEHQTVNMATHAAITAMISALAILGGVLGIGFGRRRIASVAAEVPDTAWQPAYAPPGYLPPSVHQPTAMWVAIGVLLVANATVFILIAATTHR